MIYSQVFHPSHQWTLSQASCHWTAQSMNESSASFGDWPFCPTAFVWKICQNALAFLSYFFRLKNMPKCQYWVQLVAVGLSPLQEKSNELMFNSHTSGLFDWVLRINKSALVTCHCNVLRSLVPGWRFSLTGPGISRR